MNWRDWDRENNPDYDRVNYQCTWEFQSFVIFKPTGKIYALADLAPKPANEYDTVQISVDIKDGNVVSLQNYITGSNAYYELSVDGDSLKATSLIPNTNIQVQDVMVDKFNNVYIRMSTGEQTTNGTKLYYSHNNFYKGDDGFVYELKEERITTLGGGWRQAYSLKQLNENREAVAVPEGTKAYITQGSYYNSGGWLVNGDFMFQVNWDSISVYFNGPNGYEGCGWMNMNNSDGTWEQKIFPYKGELFVITTENGVKKLTHFDISSLTEPTFEYPYRNQKDWGTQVWIEDEYILGAGETKWVDGYYATTPQQEIPGYWAYEDGTPWDYEIHGNFEYKNIWNDGHYEDEKGERIVWVSSYWADENGDRIEWIDGRLYGEGETVVGYWYTPLQYKEGDPEWEYYQIQYFSDMLDFGTRTPIVSATSAYMQKGQLYVVTDTIFSRDISTIEFIDGEIVAVNASSATFSGTVITILPLN